MAKITIDGILYEGTAEELKELFEMMGVEFPAVKSEGVFEEEPAKESLKVGDYAKVLTEPYDHEFPTNTIVKLVAKELAYDFKAEYLDGSDYWHVDETDIVRATDEEVAEAKARVTESEKWAKIGRKPNEFKKGDIVEVTTDVGGAPKIGDLLEVDRQLEKDVDVIRVSDVRGYILHNPKLITPVEAIFNA